MKKHRLVTNIGVGLWVMAASTGLAFLWKYSLSPGTVGASPTEWPAGTHVQRQGGLPNLVMTVHPRCACTRASLEELARIMARSQNRLAAHVLFVRPRTMPEGWEQGDLWEQAQAIPGVEVQTDESGSEACRFGSETSGQTLLYDRNGHLLFRGGITFARGHSGDSAGRKAILSLLDGHPPDLRQTPVFGCALQSSVESK